MKKQLPLSQFQSSVWRGQKMKPDVPLYNMVFTFDFYGEIDSDLFCQAFKLLVKKTTILKLILDESNPENPLQKTVDSDPHIEYIDTTTLDDFKLEAWISEKNKINFDLSKKSYFSALIKLANGHFVWYINQHHLFTDAYSFQVIYDKLSDIYNGLKNKLTEDDLIDDGEAYSKNFESVEKEDLTSTAPKNAFRQKTFSIYGCKFKEPSDTKSTRQLFDLDAKFVEAILNKLTELKLRTFSPNLDLLNFLMTSLVYTFSNISRTDDGLRLSNIFSKRFTKDSKKIARPLLQILNGQFNIKEGETIIDIYKKIYGFLIMRSLDDELENILPPVILNFFDLNFKDFAGIKTKSKWHHCGHMDDHHYIRFHILRYRSNDNYTLAFDIKDGHGIPNLIERLQNDFKLAISSLLEINSTQALDQVSIVEQSKLSQLKTEIEICSEKQIGDVNNIQQKLLDQFEHKKDEIALYFNQNEISYRSLKDISFSIAEKIKLKASNENPKIVIYIPRSDNYVYAVLACLFSNAVFIPVPHNFPKERLKYIVRDVNADLVIHADDQLDVELSTIHIQDCINQTYKQFEIEKTSPENDIYILYTSGSSGKPKGVRITHEAFNNYIEAITPMYIQNRSYHMPLFTSVGFDLTMTSVFLPLCTGGSIHIYEEPKGIDLSIQDVILNSKLNCFKCTPSHLRLIEDNVINSNIESIIIGGENLTRQLVENTTQKSNHKLNIFNEYGPTEATVGCIVYKYEPDKYIDKLDVAIGKPLDNYFAFIANSNGIPLPQGSVGEICIGGKGLAKSYVNDTNLTNLKFKEKNQYIPGRYYKSGDFGRINDEGNFEYLGRKDKQVKVAGIRIEIGEIEQASIQMPEIEDCVVIPIKKGEIIEEKYTYCNKCGLPSNYPTADFDEDNICGYCRSFESYKTKVEKYFKTEDDFKNIFEGSLQNNPQYDCIMLFSGGKDSSYALGKLAEKGLRVLAFTLDNGYISNEAKENIKRIVDVLGVDHIFGTTPAMNEIFVESLETHCNVCNGCFKTIYNLSLKIAFEKQIPFIVTGLSRGQFFETKLSEEIFWKPMEDVKEIERTLFEARQAYHSVNDVAYKKTGGRFIEENAVLDKVRILDFYRYHDVTLEQLYDYIKTKLPWIRPDDTGRSTNCLINKVGIFVHKQEKGYSNYAFPYSWDVRTGHKTKAETIDEIEEYIDEKEVRQIIEEIGYKESNPSIQLVAYYKGSESNTKVIKSYVRKQLPDYMIPSKYIRVDQFPLTKNGKIDVEKLKKISGERTKKIIPPSNEIEEVLHPIWQEVMGINSLSIDDDFFDLGGTSLDAIRIVSRLEKAINYKLTVNYIFEYTSIQSLSEYIIKDITSIIESNSN